MSKSIPTPNYDHLIRDFYEDVYEPAEDSFLLLDAIEIEIATIEKLKPAICIEIGPGSGIISAGIGSALGSGCFVIACDINPKACKCTLKTLAVNHCSHSDIVNIDCLEGLSHRMDGKVDLLICNPPYVETPETEEGKSDIRAAWAGGEGGMSLTNRVLSLLPRVLSSNGFALIVLEQVNKPQIVMKEAEEKFGLGSEVVVQRRAGRELLFVVKFFRDTKLGPKVFK